MKTFEFPSVIREVSPHIEKYPLAHFWKFSTFNMVIMRYPELDIELTGVSIRKNPI